MPTRNKRAEQNKRNFPKLTGNTITNMGGNSLTDRIRASEKTAFAPGWRTLERDRNGLEKNGPLIKFTRNLREIGMRKESKVLRRGL